MHETGSGHCRERGEARERIQGPSSSGGRGLRRSGPEVGIKEGGGVTEARRKRISRRELSFGLSMLPGGLER